MSENNLIEYLILQILDSVGTFNDFSQYNFGFIGKGEIMKRNLEQPFKNICSGCSYSCPLNDTAIIAENSFFCFQDTNLYLSPLKIDKLDIGMLYVYSEDKDYLTVKETAERFKKSILTLVESFIEKKQVELFCELIEETFSVNVLSKKHYKKLFRKLGSVVNCDCLVFAVIEDKLLKPYISVGIKQENLRNTHVESGLESLVLTSKKTFIGKVNENRLMLRNSIFKDLHNAGKLLFCIPLAGEESDVLGLLYVIYQDEPAQLEQYKKIVETFCQCLINNYLKNINKKKYEEQLECVEVVRRVSDVTYFSLNIDKFFNLVIDLVQTLLKPQVLAIIYSQGGRPLKIVRSENKNVLEKIKNAKGFTDFLHYLKIPLKSANSDNEGLLLFYRENNLNDVEHQFLQIICNIISVALSNADCCTRYQSMLNGTLRVLAKIIEMRDPYTFGHSERVSIYSRKLALKAGLSEEEAEKIGNAAFLHDIGKIFLPDKLLMKTEQLNNREKELIKTHPAKGAEIVAALFDIPHVHEVVRYHHERLDGSGYPDGLTADEIPLSAKIVAIADSYEAMIHRRVYREAMGAREAYQELVAKAGKKYDAKLVELFREVIFDELVFKYEENIIIKHGIKIIKSKFDELTTREKEVLALLADGYNNQEIAQALYVTEQTVKSHVSKILQKLGVEDRTKAAVYALKAGWFNF